ncbi:putative methyltransferase-domain-containing protein [Baffinella frigidus]|nr:putative methyltransferase-domain-containing protein [Cryptophyta sp. CCMP2293]|eukprot:CAMPEP_0180147512 /NCGR_PEP_ID=MMETSP0986-20121125/19319_1 /TAXON_ID=697907 /ORGANISM="non described non described, Strain CCMP2293" /LENGTH=345 /DNA_ID=CAMNT_0022093113 /DNA_START=79 /DNA_END=1116 /DNA_ORIENTATION=+
MRSTAVLAILACSATTSTAFLPSSLISLAPRLRGPACAWKMQAAPSNEGSQESGALEDRRRFLSRAACVVGAMAGGAASAEAAAPFSRFTDQCETDQCIFRDRREFTRAGRKIAIKQSFDKNGSRSTGSAVWEGDVVLTKYMQDEPEVWKGKRVIELGAGTGLASIVAALLGATEITLTDGDSKVLELAKKNLEANLSPAELAASGLEVAQLRWEAAADPAWKFLRGEGVDLIVAADCTYYKDYIPPLMRVMQRLSGPNTQIYLTHTVRPSDGNSMDQFYDNFQVEKVSKGPAFDGHPETFLFKMKPLVRAPGSPALLAAPEDDGCRPGYFKRKDINLCVPKPAA